MKQDVFTGKYPSQKQAEFLQAAYSEAMEDALARTWEDISDKEQQAWCKIAIDFQKEFPWFGGGFTPSMAGAQMEDRIKCSLCGWSTMRWKTNKKGKVNSYYLLVGHYMICHQAEYEELQTKLKEVEK